MQTPEYDLAIVGLGYVGLTLAVAFAQRGLRVLGVERRADVVAMTNRGEPHFAETGLAPILADVVARGLLRASERLEGAPCPAYVITVGTPLDGEGKPRLDMVRHAAGEVRDHMGDDALVVLRSTVKLGTTRNVVAPILVERDPAVLVAMCPERTLEGDALREIAVLPQIVGGCTPAAVDRAAALFGRLTHSVVRVSSPETAEMIKLVDNTYRDVRFGFANEVARACDAIGVDAYEVIEQGKLGYARTDVAMPGLVGGPCLEKDPHILRASLAEYDVDLEMTGAARLVNERQPVETIGALLDELRGRGLSSPRVAVAGIAFKGLPETNDLRGAMALKVIVALQAGGVTDITLFDPVATPEELAIVGDHPVAPSLTDAAAGADVVILTNNHPSLRQATFETLARVMATGGIVFDYWSHYRHEGGLANDRRYLMAGNMKRGVPA